MSVTETPEFQAAVAQTVAALVPQLKAQIIAELGKGVAGISGPDQAFAESLAMAIAQLTDQGSGRKRLAPEVVRARSEAREKMLALIVEARSLGQRPLYGLRNKVYLDETLVEPVYIDKNREQKQTEIEWPGVPSEAMVPLNDVAKGIFEQFSASIGTVPKEHLAPERPLSVTANGLVIKGQSKAVQPAVVLGAAATIPEPAEEGLKVKGRSGMGRQTREIRVLGTVAPAARMGV